MASAVPGLRRPDDAAGDGPRPAALASKLVATPAASVPPFDPMGPHMMAAASLPEQLIWETETQSFRPPLTIESALAEKPRVVFVGEQPGCLRRHKGKQLWRIDPGATASFCERSRLERSVER